MDLWRVDGNQRKNQAASSKESWSNDNMSDRLGAGGRRLSDGAPVPFNRTRSFKTKQLVRSQAIRESQSPPRVPSPRPPGHPASDTDRTRIQPAVKKKAVSVDLDDRNTTSTAGTLYVNHQSNPGKLDRGSSSNYTKSDGNDSKADGNIPKTDGMDYSKSGKMEYSNPNNQQKISHSHVNKNSVKVQSNKQYEANIRYVKNHNDKLNVSAIAKNSSRDIVDNLNATTSEFGIQKASPISIDENIKTVKTTWANNNNVKRSNMNVEVGGTVESSKDFANRLANSAKQTEVKKLGAIVVTELKVASENSKGDGGVASDKNKGFSVASDGRKGLSDKKKESENSSDTGVVKHAANCTCAECVVVSVVSRGDSDAKVSSNVGGGDKKVATTGEPGTCAVKQILRPDRGSLSEARGALGVSGEDEKAGKKSPNKSKVEFQQVEIQVTSGDNESTQASSTVTQSGSQNVEKECDMRRCMLEENEEEDSAKWGPNSRGRRAVCPSKQDSGICCWEQCACCGDVSPDLNIQYFDENEEAARQSRRLKFIAGYDFQYSLDQCRSVDRWNNRRAGSTLVVQRGNSGNGNNLRLLRKQSSGGSVDSSQHSLGPSTPYLSRDNSSEIVPAPPLEPTDLDKFVKETLNKSYKDRLALLKLEHEMMMLIKDPNCRTLKFPQLSSYSRMLVHRCADLFCLKHGLDMTTKQIVYVTKPAPGTATIPQLCPFQQWCTEQFWGTPGFDSSFCENSPQAKSILKRDAHSLDEEAAALQPSKPTARSKSFEQREEEYSRARRRIFNTTEDGVVTCDWLGTENDPERPRLLMPEGDRSQRAGRLLKVQSLESREPAPVIRGIVSKAHSFGGYGDRREGIRREDSTASAHSAPPTRILSQKGELAINNWRLSPGNSSGYRTLSARSDSITPSPTPNMTVDMNAGTAPGVLWAITDMGSVPPGALIIHPPTGQPLFNSDGSVYYYDPERPPSSLMTKSQIQVEGVRVLTNPERRRSRLEKQRATLSPGTETDTNTEKLKSPDLRENAELTNTKNPLDQMKPLHEEIVPHTTTNFNLTPLNDESKPICACQDCQTKANTKPTNNSIDQTYQHQNPTIQHNIADPTSQAYKQNIQQAKQSTTTKDIYSQCDIATNESQINLPLVEKLSAKPSTEGLKSASPNLIAVKSSSSNKEMYASDSNNPRDSRKPEISVNAVITEETMEDCLKSVLRNTTPRDGCAPKEEFNVLKDDAVIQFGYVKPDDFKDCKKFAGGLSEHQLMQNLAQKPYEYAANMAAGNLEEEKPECCVREEGLYDPIIQERNQEYMVAPVFPDSGYYANAPPMGQFYNNLYEEPNPELQQQYQAGQMALQQRGASHPSSGLMQPSPMVYPHHLMQNPMHQSPYPVQSEEVHPFQVQAPPPPPPGLVPQHPPQLYQVQGAPGWGWPVVYGAPQSQAQPLQDVAGSKMPQHGSQFIPQASEPPMNPVPTMQAGFYPQAVLMAPQPPQYYPFQPNPHQLISMQHPQQQQPIPPPYAIYHQPYQPERSSVLSQEGSSTPGFNMQYDTTLTPQQNFNINQFNQSLDLMKQRNFQTKSPKNNLVNSRGQSDSGSSRATPLMTYQGYSTAASMPSVQSFGGMEGQGFLNAMHFGQQNAVSNYGILPFSYPPNDGLIQNVQFENGNAKNRHNIGVKPWGKDGGDYPRNSYNDRKEATNQMERNMDAIQRADSMFVENQDDRFNKLRDRRKVFRTATSGGSLSRQDSFDQDGQSVDQPPNQSNFNRSIDGRSRFNNGKIVDKPPNLDLKDITFNNEQQKARFVPISKELADRVATSNLSNEAKAFIPKDIPTTEQATTTASVETEVQASVVTTSAPSTSVAASSEDKPTVSDDSKSSNQSVVTNTDRKPLFHNKQNVNTNMNVKNFNNANSLNRNNRDSRQGFRNTMGVGGVHDYKGGIRNERDDRSFRSYFQREPASPTVQTRTATATWVQRNIDSPVQRCSNGSSANASPAPVFSFPNLSHPPPTQNQNISSYVRAPSAYQHHSTSQHSQRVNHSGNPHQGHPAYPRNHNFGHLSNVQCQYGNGNPLQGHPAYPRNHNLGHLSNVQCQYGNGNAAALNKEFGSGVGAYGLAKTGFRGNAQAPIANPAGGMGLVQQSLMGQQRLQEQLLQRSQLLQSFGGAGLMQTPPAQGALLFRQIPNWLRRAQAPGIFGPPPAYAARAARPPPPAPR